jgi:signal transduction histidine kinase
MRVSPFLLRRGPFGGDGLIAIVAAIACELELGLSHHIQGPRAVNAISALLVTLPIAWRRRWPLLVAPAVTAVIAIQEVAGGDLTENSLVPMLTIPLAVYALGAICARRQALIGFVTALGLAWIAVAAADESLGTFVFVTALVGGPFLVGRIVNARTELAFELADKAIRLQGEQERQAELAVAEERERIAREMNDVLAHHVTGMVVQTQAARRMIDRDPERAREALDSIEATGREALGAMRRMVGVMGNGGEPPALAPQPSIAELDELVERARAAGLDVEVNVEGDRRRVESTVDLSVFRIVQEVLTNAAKHPGPTHAEVILRYGENDVEVDVSDYGPAPRPAKSGGGEDQGLVGIRERVAMLGGELEAGYRKGGGWGVHARLPLTPEGS